MSKTIGPDDSLSIIVFGATGDLSKRKIFHSIYSLFLENTLPFERVTVSGFARSKLSNEQFREAIKPQIANRVQPQKKS